MNRFAREFKWLGGQTGALRDLDVYLLKLDDYRASLRFFLDLGGPEATDLAPGLDGAVPGEASPASPPADGDDVPPGDEEGGGAAAPGDEPLGDSGTDPTREGGKPPSGG